MLASPGETSGGASDSGGPTIYPRCPGTSGPARHGGRSAAGEPPPGARVGRCRSIRVAVRDTGRRLVRHGTRRPITMAPKDARRSRSEAVSTLGRFRQVIARVPRGKVITYGRVAEAAGVPGGARLTVRALQQTGLPWHRVVASQGRIALPGEEGREQRLRLEMEGVVFRGGRVRMDLHEWSPTRRPGPDRRRPAPRVGHSRRSRSPGTGIGIRGS